MSDVPYVSLRDANIARQAEWDSGNQLTLTYRGNEMAGEVGEACNVIKKLERERLGIKGSRATVEQLAEELADVVICADLIAMHEGIDLDSAVARKFNATSEKVGLRTRLLAGFPEPPAPDQLDRRSGFTDGNGKRCKEGCVVEHRDGARRARLMNVFQDGDAEVRFFDTGNLAMVKWKNLCWIED